MRFSRKAVPLPREGSGTVEVGRDPPGLICPQLHGPGEDVVGLRNLGFLIDYAAGGTAAEGDRRRALQHRDFLHIEGIAIIASEVAHAIEENVVARGEAADGQIVALRSAFSRGQADAGNVAQGIAQRGRALVLDDVLGNDVDGLGSLNQRLG